ncbi:MAG TPA: lipoyl(octanoyl) transferase LipB [Chitinophagaceae bacterium]|nr:lipoyl(octanoyl) transferase LipB [Chitinophagaceae bacterium]HPG11739.1 lipoyl(octanoyl) transferase LipB [Chitinophagaceae bacterium]
MEKQKILFTDLGLMAYKDAWDYQETLLQQNVKRKSGNKDETKTEHFLLFVEHPPVYTLGKNGNIENVLMREDELRQNGIDFFNTNRGGDITYHGPGQIVGYPILDLEHFFTDIGRYLRNIEEVIILTLKDYGLTGQRSKGETGVWLDTDIPGRERKICAIGVRCSRWVTMHGFALNVNTDLSYFNHIIPCGIQNKQVTSLEKELGHKLDIGEVKEKVKKHFMEVFEAEMVEDQNSFSR